MARTSLPAHRGQRPDDDDSNSKPLHWCTIHGCQYSSDMCPRCR